MPASSGDIYSCVSSWPLNKASLMLGEFALETRTRRAPRRHAFDNTLFASLFSLIFPAKKTFIVFDKVILVMLNSVWASRINEIAHACFTYSFFQITAG